MAICGLLAFALYANTLQYGYVVDDRMVIDKNKYTQEGISAFSKIVSTPYRAGFWDRQEGLYRPLSLLMFATEWNISPDTPQLSHWVNVLLYSLTGMMLFVMLTLFFEGKNVALPFAATILFVAHPIHTEVVANIKSRDEILCFLFCIISLWAIVKYARLGKGIYLLWSGLAIFLAMLSKETAVTMVVIAPLTVYFFSTSSRRTILISAAPFIGAFLVYMLIRISVLSGASNFEAIQLINNSLAAAGNDISTRLATALYVVGIYLRLLVFPHPLSFDYSYNSIPLVSFSNPQTLLVLVIIGALSAIVVKGWKSKNPLTYSILFFAATLSLVSNIFFLIEATLGERFLYMPSLGFCIAITVLLAKVLGKKEIKSSPTLTDFLTSNKSILGVLLVITLLYAIKAFTRNKDWTDDLTLVRKDVMTEPHSARIRYAYGSILVMEKGLNEVNTLEKQKLLENGMHQLQEAVKILPDYGDAWFNLGMAYNELEMYSEALISLEKANEHSIDKEARLYIALGVAYGQNKQYDKAFDFLKKAIELDSASDDAYTNMGLFYSKMGNYEKSREMLQKAIAIDSTNEKAYFNLGNDYADAGDFHTAIEFYQKALKVNPKLVIAMNNMGNSYGAMKEFTNAREIFMKALQIDPFNEEAKYNLGVTYYMMGDTVNAMKYLPPQN